MEITTQEIIVDTWNIGGGHVLRPGANPAELASFTDEGLDSFVKTLESEPKADVVALQEVHSKGSFNQAEEIAKRLGYSFVRRVLSPSHVGTGYDAGLALLTPHKIIDSRDGLFTNPNIETKWEWGETKKSHDKGYLSFTIDVNGEPIEITTFHLFPFRRLGLGTELTLPKAQTMLRDIGSHLASNSDIRKQIKLGDFNIDHPTVRQFLPELFDAETTEAELPDPTTPKGRYYDHVIFRGMNLLGLEINDKARTDHYPVRARFKI